MPGIFGIVGVNPSEDLPALVERIDSRATAGSRLERETLIDPLRHWALGRAHLGVLQPGRQLEADHTVHAMFHGDLYNERELRSALAAGSSPETTAAAPLVAALYQRDGSRLVERLSGAFCGAVLDTAAREIHLFVDPLSTYPLYWAIGPRGLVFASELRGLLRTGWVPRRLDPRAVADYLTFGFPFGTKTLAEGVELLPAGSILTYRWSDGTVTLRQYADMCDAFEPWTGTRAAFFDELGAAFTNAVTRSLSGSHAFGLSLSGGMDSRAILSALNGQARTMTTYTLGVDGCADQIISKRLAQIAGTQHKFFALDDRYLSEFLPNLARMVSMTDGMYLSHGLTEILALNFLDDTNVSVLLRGHGGELAKTNLAWPFHTDAAVRAMRTRAEFLPYLLQRANYISRNVNWQDLFTPEWAPRVLDAPRRSLEQTIDRPALSPADLCSYVYLMEHHRRFTVGSLELFRHRVEVRLPFVDYELLRVLFRAPAEWRETLDIHKALTGRHSPALLHVRNSNTGAAGDAGPLTELALDKVNTLLKRLNVRGYRHYHNFDAWMQDRLLESVHSVLLDRQTVDRGIFQPAAIRRLMDDTRSGAADHAYLLQVMLIVELWQRENL